MKGTISISWGGWGGVYFHKGFSTRVCLGFVAITYFPEDLDILLEKYRNYNHR